MALKIASDLCCQCHANNATSFQLDLDTAQARQLSTVVNEVPPLPRQEAG